MACICGNTPKRKDSMAARRHEMRCLDLKAERTRTLAGQIEACPEESPARPRLEARWRSLTGRDWNHNGSAEEEE